MKTAVVCGAGGFIGGHLVGRLKRDGYRVRGVDIKRHEFRATAADEFLQLDLREPANCVQAVRVDGRPADEVYQLAADMGGMGFIHSAECEIMRNSLLINTHMSYAAACQGVGRYLFSSSACVYRDQTPDEPDLAEDDAYPGQPDNEYGWEKLYSERVALAYQRNQGMTVRIARFQNCYGPYGTWRGGREKAPAAMCRKLAAVPDGGTIEVWGDGTAMRVFTYVDDLVDGIRLLMDSGCGEPTNIGSDERVSVNDLVALVAETAGKTVGIRHVDGPVGVHARNHSSKRIRSMGWTDRHTLRQGIARTYPWVKEQTEQAIARGEAV
ncbi:MAG TPA: NAD-dependent epimerase/dehydratase family protein [Vicinamibacteria bacterium]|nr:NAD-dependent epimerase/dehydratase family protein [Vicinamibacteria bacterium]